MYNFTSQYILEAFCINYGTLLANSMSAPGVGCLFFMTSIICIFISANMPYKNKVQKYRKITLCKKKLRKTVNLPMHLDAKNAKYGTHLPGMFIC